MKSEGINSKRVYQLAGVMVVGAVLTYFGVLLLFNYFARERSGARQVVVTVARLPLEIDSGEPLAELRKKEDLNLKRLEWVNRAAGQVRIPIERAMEIIVQKNGGGARAK